MSIFPSESAAVNAPAWKYDGIGGWLILVAMGLMVSPLIHAKNLLIDLLPVFTGGAWSVLTTPGTAPYHPLWGPVILFEVVMNVVFIVAEIILLILMFRKHPVFPTVVSIWLIGTFLFTVADHFLAHQIPAVVAQKDFSSRSAMIRTAIHCLIWINYFRVSSRVKATFRVRSLS